MHTSIAFLAFIAGSPAPSWLSYEEAQGRVQEERRPLAVFIGSGQRGFSVAAREGSLSPSAQKVLAEKYLCVYVDVATGPGSQLAREFAVGTGKGLVISDRTGRFQVFHHDGDLSTEEITRNLDHFANTTLVSYYQAPAYHQPVGRSC